MKKENTITNNPAKVAKTEKIIKKLETFLKTNSGQKFVNYVHKERIDIICKRFHQDYLICTNLTHTLNMVTSTMDKLGIKPEVCTKEPISLEYVHHKQPKMLLKHAIRNKYTRPTLEKKSECGIMCERYITRHLTRKELINGYKAHKLDKWLANNPEPVEQDATGQLNMFYESSHADWKKNLDGMKIKIEDQIIRKYNPNLMIIGRYRITEDNYGKPPYTVSEDKYIEKPIGIIEDKENTARFINFLTEDKGIIKTAKDIVTEEKKKDSRLICGYLRDHNNKVGRLIDDFKQVA